MTPAGAAEREKPAAPPLIVKATDVEAARVPDVPVTVTGTGPTGDAVPLAVRVKTLVEEVAPAAGEGAVARAEVAASMMPVNKASVGVVVEYQASKIVPLNPI